MPQSKKESVILNEVNFPNLVYFRENTPSTTPDFQKIISIGPPSRCTVVVPSGANLHLKISGINALDIIHIDLERADGMCIPLVEDAYSDVESYQFPHEVIITPVHQLQIRIKSQAHIRIEDIHFTLNAIINDTVSKRCWKCGVKHGDCNSVKEALDVVMDSGNDGDCRLEARSWILKKV